MTLPEKRAFNRQMAVNEAQRCLQCTEPKCNDGCPAGVDVQRFVAAIATGDFVGAIKALYEKNALPLSCAHICPAEIQCMEGCRHTELNFPVMINVLQEWISRYAIEQNLFQPKPGPEQSGRVAVVGGGPSGLAAAMKLRQAGYGVSVFERTRALGGMLRHCIPLFRLPREALDLEIEMLRRLGIEFNMGAAILDAGRLLQNGYDAVYIATGLWNSMPLDLDQATGPGVYEALPFLADCVTGHGEARYGLRNKRVVIVGGGSVAMDVSAAAVRMGARSVTIATLESPAEMPAAPDENRRAWNDGVLFESRVMPLGVVRDGEKVVGLRAVRIEWKEPGLILPSNAVQLKGSALTLPGDILFLAVGQRPDKESEQLVERLDKEHTLPKVDEESGMTSQPGIFAGGDLVNGGGTAAGAIGDGIRAAEGIAAFLRKS